MKKTTLILTFVLAATIAWADNKAECLTRVQANAAAKGTTSFKQQGKKEKTERKDVLRVINEIDCFCKNLASDIKVLEAADSLNEFVWEHRDSLDNLPKDTLKLFLDNLRSIQLTSYPPISIHTVNTDAWKDIVSKEVVEYAEYYFAYKIVLTKMYDAFWEKKQRINDIYCAEVEYSQDKVETTAEEVKRMLASPEVRSLFGQQPMFCAVMKGTRSSMKSMNASNKNLMQVTDKDLSEMFGNEQTADGGISFRVHTETTTTTNK